MIEHLTGGGFIVDLMILSKEQQEVLEILKKLLLSNRPFYLAGGTGLALILGHRKSIDFDFFSESEFSPIKITNELKNYFQEEQLSLVEMKEDTLIVLLKTIQTSFFNYNYPLLKPTITENGLTVASIEDISAMKLISIMQRGLKKDFIDLWTVIKETKYTINDIFYFCRKKYGSAFSESIALKALTYFNDAEEDETPEGLKYNYSWHKIKKDLIRKSLKYFNEQIKKEL
jgi:predicted nucleotidyltransferase component of viral defense system